MKFRLRAAPVSRPASTFAPVALLVLSAAFAGQLTPACSSPSRNFAQPSGGAGGDVFVEGGAPIQTDGGGGASAADSNASGAPELAGGGQQNEGGGSTCDGSGCAASEARLKLFTLAPAAMSPMFDPDVESYTADFSYFEPTLTLSAVPISSDASMSYLGGDLTPSDEPELAPTLPGAPTLVTVEVTASDSKTIKSYQVALRRRPLETTYFKAFNARAEAWFGQAVALDGNTAVVGAPGESSPAQGVDGNEGLTGAPAAGAAYVASTGPTGEWQRDAYLKALDTSQGAAFGGSVDIDHDTIVIGSPSKENSKGAAYIFVRLNGTWSQQAMLTEPTRVAGDYFGSAVAVQGDHVYVGANNSSNLFNYYNGAVYSWTRSGDTWTLDSNLPNPPSAEFTASSAAYGTQIVPYGDRVAIAGYTDVYVMVREGATWVVEGHMKSTQLMGIAFDGDTLAMASLGVGVHIYTRSGASWVKQTTLLSFDAAAEPFGTSVALSGNLIVVGSRGANEAGGISTFVRNGSAWEKGEYLAPSSIESKDLFGSSVAASGTRILVGAWGESSSAKAFDGDSSNNGASRAGAAFILE